MKDHIIAWAAWHPEKGFDEFAYEGSVAFANLTPALTMDIKDLNNKDRTNNKTGWRAVKVRIVKEGA